MTDRARGEDTGDCAESLARAREQLRHAEEVQREKTLFLAMVSHEIRTPMNGVVGMANLLAGTPLSDEQRDYVDTIRTSAEALLAVVNDVLEFSKIESGSVHLEQLSFDLRTCVEDSVDLFAQLAATRDVRLTAHFLPGSPEIVHGDPSRLRQIIVNLLSNAVKFTEHGQIVVEVRPRPREDLVEIAVRDTGVGISADTLGRLFLPFSQAGSSSRMQGGSGLGLAICARLVRLMSGDIGVTTEVGRGTSFTFTVAAREPTSRDIPRIRLSSALLGARVLLVSPDEVTRVALSDLLRASGAEPIAVSSVADARELSLGANVGAVVVDIDGDGDLDEAADLGGALASGTVGLPVLGLVRGSGRAAAAASGAFAAVITRPARRSAVVEALGRAMLHVAEPAGSVAVMPEIDEHLAELFPLRILVAEDNPVNQKVARLMLARLGYQADLAVTGAEVLRRLDESLYDLVFMDVQMPEMDGLEATRRVRVRSGRQPTIIAMTASAFAGDRDLCLAAGMDDHVAKPVSLSDLARAIRSVGERGGLLDRGHDPLVDRGQVEELSRVLGEDSMRDLVAEFRRSTTELMSRARRAIEEGRASDLHLVAHSLKSSAAQVGAQRLSLVCRDLEVLARQDRITEAARLIPRLTFEVRRAFAAIEAV